MNKRFFFLLPSILLFLSVSLLAQKQKKSVGVAPFSFNRQSASQESALTIYNYVIQALDATQRFSVKDRLYGLKVVSDEQDLTKDEKFMDGDVLVSKGKLEDAEWMISGQIMSATAVPVDEESGGGFQSNIAFFIRVYDVVTGEVVASQIITENGRTDFSGGDEVNFGKDSGFWGKLWKKSTSAGKGQNKQEALSIGMQKLLPHIKSFVREKFPFTFDRFTIKSEFGEEKVMVIGHENMGVELGQVFDVVYLDQEDFDGEIITAKRHKGQLKIDELASKVFYLVPKNKKNDYILSFMKENKEKIILVESGKKATWLDENPLSRDKEKKKRRKEERQRKKAEKKKKKAKN